MTVKENVLSLMVKDRLEQSVSTYMRFAPYSAKEGRLYGT
jgi:hypothetical protein